MDKSYNDIQSQVARCIALANELGGKYKANAKKRVDNQYFAKIGGQVRAARGIPIFGADRDRKYPLIIVQVAKPEPEPEPVIVKPVMEIRRTPTEQAEDRMTWNDWMSASAENRKMIQDECRHLFINKMYAELLQDMTFCKYEGWDPLEFPRMLQDALSVCFPKKGVQLSLFND